MLSGNKTTHAARQQDNHGVRQQGKPDFLPPKEATQGLMPPVPTAIRARPIRENSLKKEKYIMHRIILPHICFF
jgi:hypothetical protein